MFTMNRAGTVHKNMDLLCRGQQFYRTDLPEAILVNMHVDPKGYIVYWTYPNMTSTVDHLDFSYILDVRYGKYAILQGDKLAAHMAVLKNQLNEGFLRKGSEKQLDSCFLTIVTAFNTIVEEKLQFYYFLAPSPEIAQLWGDALFKFSRYRTIGNGSVLSCLEAIYAKLRYGTNTSKIKSKDIAKFFTSCMRTDGNTIERALQVSHLPAGTLDSVVPEKLSEIRLFKFYMIVTSRKDVEALFMKLLENVEDTDSGILEEVEDEEEDSETEEAESLKEKLQDFGCKMDADLLDQIRQEQQRKSKIAYALHRLVNYMTAVGAKNFSYKYCDKRNMSSEMYSFNEDKAQELLTREPASVVNHHKRQITRVYPKARRADSSNYMPQNFWNAGCQMVALNFQTLDLPMQLNLAVFEFNGKSGYILKPECMRRRDSTFQPFTEYSIENVVPNTVSVQVISAQFLSTLSDKTISSYVEVEMFGLAADTYTTKQQGGGYRTKTVNHNAINPLYMDSSSTPFVFKKILLPELAYLKLTVMDERSRKMLGFRLLPVLGMRPGYRHILLRNAANQPLRISSLFVKIEVNDYVAPEHQAFVDLLVNPTKHLEETKKWEEALQDPISWQQKQQKKNENLLKKLKELEEEPEDFEFPPPATPITDTKEEKPPSPSASYGKAMGGLLSNLKHRY